MTRKYNKKNCTTCVRCAVKDQYGRTIVLTGTFAFEWTINIIVNHRVTSMTFKDGKTARKQFKTITKKH